MVASKLLISTILLSSLSIAADCKLIDTYKKPDYVMGGKRLTPFWSQEYSGADLVREEMRSIEDKSLVDVGLLDTGFEKFYINVKRKVLVEKKFTRRGTVFGHHGTNVANLINGDFPYGATDQANYLGLTNITAGGHANALKRIKKSAGKWPKVISNSVGWKYDSATELSLELADQGVLWFLAAGNTYPNNVAEIEDKSGAILIGSFAPSGLQSSFSQVSDNVVVLAPADEMQASIDGIGKHNLFGGTSGATPIVAGVVINIVSLYPELNRSDIIELLKKSSFQSYDQVRKSDFQPGLFNGYKAFKVIEKIRAKCESLECVKEAIRSDDTYYFSSNDIRVDKTAHCKEQKKQFKALRKDALLSNDEEQLKALADIYLESGYNKNFEYYNHLSTRFSQTESFIKELEESAIAALKDEHYFASYFRYQFDFGQKYQLSLASLLVHDSSIDRYWTSSFLIRYQDKLAPEVKGFLEHSLSFANEELRSYIEDIIYM